MIQQKAAELLFSISPSKRTLADLKHAIDQAGQAQKYAFIVINLLSVRVSPMFVVLTIRLFASLAADKSHMLPYSREIADQRRKYGESMLRKGAEHLGTQEQYEAEVREKLDTARQKRQEEKERVSALEACFSFQRFH